MSTNGDDPKDKLPIAAHAIFNQIGLGLAKHQRITSTISKHRSSTTTTTTTTQGIGRGFSSLATTGHAPNGTEISTPHHFNSQSNGGSSGSGSGIEDEQDLYSASSNAGLGFSPSPSPASSSSSSKNNGESKDTAALRRRVLGRNAARQVAEAKANRKRMAEDSESEEEVGKGSLVKAGGRARVKAKRTEEYGREGEGNGVDGPARKKVRVGEVLAEEEEGKEIGPGAAAASELNGNERDEGDADDTMGDADASVGVAEENDGHRGAGQGQLAAEKKMRKKNKKNKKTKKKQERGNDGKVEVEGSEKQEASMLSEYPQSMPPLKMGIQTGNNIIDILQPKA
ncbi:uncharacterized protein B0T15DRAFT_512518 [Chaetomium strumarium]|uniref:Uncharacterized protein n=1 Tax=Chaetomium strumarium TaxID=1170767 RepID=A0AAJ0GQM5_9PEZI|nr:hypothetical protein B0T15DRAFT_512518 [Chaetomium strumarium]